MKTTALDILAGKGISQSRTVQENKELVEQFIEIWEKNCVSLTRYEIENTAKFSDQISVDEFMTLWSAITNILSSIIFLKQKPCLTEEDKKVQNELQAKIPNVKLFTQLTQVRLRAILEH